MNPNPTSTILRAEIRPFCASLERVTNDRWGPTATSDIAPFGDTGLIALHTACRHFSISVRIPPALAPHFATADPST
jgi:hypothetical protein